MTGDRASRAARLVELRARARDRAALVVHAAEGAVESARRAIDDAERAFTETADKASTTRFATMGDFAEIRGRLRALGQRVEWAKGALARAEADLVEKRLHATEIALELRKAEAWRDATLREARKAAAVVERKQTDEIAARTFERRRGANASSAAPQSAPTSREGELG